MRSRTRPTLALGLTAMAMAMAVAIWVALPLGSASAHGGNPDYRSIIHGVKPSPLGHGISTTVLDFDADIQLQNKSGKTVLIRGYDREPYARIYGNGQVQVNVNSPAYYLNEDRFGDVAVPKSAGANVPPKWKGMGGGGVFTWHDHRSHYMSTGTPTQVTDKSKRTKIFDYEIPIDVGGKRAALDGTLFWVGPDSSFPIAPFIGLAVVLLLGVGFVVIRRRRGRHDGSDEDGGGSGNNAEPRGNETPGKGTEEVW